MGLLDGLTLDLRRNTLLVPDNRRATRSRTGMGWEVPPPPCPGTTLRKNQPLVPRWNSRITFFTRVVGFLVDVGQLFRCAGHHFMCVTTGPPIRGDPISHSQAHIPLKPLPPALDPFPEAQTGIQDGVSQEEGFHVSAS